MRHCLPLLLIATAATVPLAAQPQPASPPAPPAWPEISIAGPSGRVIWMGGARTSSWLGITLGRADATGLLVESVTDSSPAASAGLRAGARLAAVDGTPLTVDAGDAGDNLAESLPERRLRRVLAAKKPGESIEFTVVTDGRRDTKRVTLAEPPRERAFTVGPGSWGTAAGRRVLGVTFSERGSMRDTAGLLIVSVTEDGAAERAGIAEGDRLVSVDGVDLRVHSADAGSSDGVRARINRLRRLLDAAKDSQPVRVELLTDGRRRTVSVTPTRERGLVGFTMNPGQGMYFSGPDGFTVNVDAERMRGMAEELRANAERLRDGVRANVRGIDGEVRQLRMRGSRTISASTDNATLSLGGLTLATIDEDFARQLGRGSEEGALVLRVTDRWAPLKAGDVLLSVEGARVRSGSELTLTVDRSRAQRLQVLRDGRRQELTLPAQ